MAVSKTCWSNILEQWLQTVTNGIPCCSSSLSQMGSSMAFPTPREHLFLCLLAHSEQSGVCEKYTWMLNCLKTPRHVLMFRVMPSTQRTCLSNKIKYVQKLHNEHWPGTYRVTIDIFDSSDAAYVVSKSNTATMLCAESHK